MRDLRAATCILTGASRGIGRVAARHLARQGVRLVLAARTAVELDEVAREVTTARGYALACPTDVRDEAALRALVERTEREVGPVDLLINNAGLEQTRAYEEVPLDDLRRLLEVNLVSPMLLTRLVLPGMLARGRGHVVNVSSLAGKSGPPFVASYAASKFGLVGFTQSLRVELAGRGVSASVVCPGFVRDAGMFADATRQSGARAPRLVGSVTADEVAAAIVRAIREDLPEVLVGHGPLRLAGALFELWPRAREVLVARVGVKKVFGDHARAGVTTGRDDDRR